MEEGGPTNKPCRAGVGNLWLTGLTLVYGAIYHTPQSPNPYLMSYDMTGMGQVSMWLQRNYEKSKPSC